MELKPLLPLSRARHPYKRVGYNFVRKLTFYTHGTQNTALVDAWFLDSILQVFRNAWVLNLCFLRVQWARMSFKCALVQLWCRPRLSRHLPARTNWLVSLWWAHQTFPVKIIFHLLLKLELLNHFTRFILRTCLPHQSNHLDALGVVCLESLNDLCPYVFCGCGRQDVAVDELTILFLVLGQQVLTSFL